MIERGRKLEEGVKLGREPVLGAQPPQEAGLEEGRLPHTGWSGWGCWVSH